MERIYEYLQTDDDRLVEFKDNDVLAWAVLVLRGVRDLDVCVELADSETFEGIPTDEPGGGYNVSVIVTTIEGVIVGQFCPYNYTKGVWTQDRVELEARIESLLEGLEEYLKKVMVVEPE